MKPKVLIVEDDEAVRSQWRWALADHCDVLLAADPPTAIETFRTERPELSLVDLGLPPHADDPSEGLALLGRLRSLDRHARVIAVSGLADHKNAVQAVGGGACDFLAKPVPVDALKLLVQRCLNVAALEREFLAQQQAGSATGCEGLLGHSLQMQEVFATVGKVAPADAPVLLVGENGTGKETTARAIHQLSPRHAGPFVVVDCGAIPPEQVEGQLFGTEEPRLEGASVRHPGRIEVATGGTLFLDGINHLSAGLQVRLFRFLQERRVESHPGEQDALAGDTRMIAAISVEPATALAAGQLRSDLFYLLAVVVIRIPPLRERRDDIRELARLFLKRFADLYRKPELKLGTGALRALDRHRWPGNVRELENCVKRAVIMADRDTIEETDLDLPTPSPSATASGLREARHETEREMLLRALRRHQGRIAPAAVELGISRPTFYALMRRLGLRRGGGPLTGMLEPADGNGI